MMTREQMVLAAAPYDTRTADAMRRACGVFARRQWTPFTVIDGDEYDRYASRLKSAYETDRE